MRDKYYIKLNTNYGCPYVGENCDVIKPSDNLIIYGHHCMFIGQSILPTL